ncbi:MAG: hypothetical protein IJ583_04415 [Firmicutes bacterium]|nr:hypothetical protein [Bacillota bacterium]
MIMTLKADLLGVEEKTSAKGNRYTTMLLKTGIETLTLMADLGSDSLKIMDLKEYGNYNFSLDYAPRWKSFKIVNISKA